MFNNCKMMLPPFKSKSKRHLSNDSKLYGQGESVSISFSADFPRDYRTAIMNRLPFIVDGCNLFYHIVPSFRSGQIRIMNLNDGYWSYLGNDADGIGLDDPTMNFQDLPKDFMHVIDHEFGHGLFARLHEHKHPEFITGLDKDAVYMWAENVLGWSRNDVDFQILTAPKGEGLVMHKYQNNSSMHYGFPAQVTKNKKNVLGGKFFTKEDIEFNKFLYPLNLPVTVNGDDKKEPLEVVLDLKGALNVFFEYKSLGVRLPKYLFIELAEILKLSTKGKEKELINRIKSKINEF